MGALPPLETPQEKAILHHDQKHGKLQLNRKKDNPASGLSSEYNIFICFAQATAL